MKKIFKAISVLAATAAMGAGVALASGCAGGNGSYVGSYTYDKFGVTYGIVVEVTVENNIIKNIKDITNTDNAKAVEIQTYQATGEDKATHHDWHVVSPGWETYSKENGMEGMEMPDWYSWSDDNADNWTSHENWLLQQYIGWSVADVLDVSVFYDGYGEPYASVPTNYNTELTGSGLLISGATQGSGRLLLAVQNALSK